MLETSHLRCFVTVAEELHFGRAAQRLNMTQPPLSRQIQLLEHAMRCELFYRNSRTVRLTHAGQTFLPEAQRILRMIELASASALDVAGGRKGLTRCGFTASAAYDFLPRFVARLEESLPGASLSLREMVSREQMTALESGEIEMGFLRAVGDRSLYECQLIAREDLLVTVPSSHPLAAKERIQWKDLHQQRFIDYEPHQGQYFHRLISAKLALDGILPNVVQSLAQIHSILALVRAGAGLAVVPESARMIGMSGIQYRALDDPNPAKAELYVIWLAANDNPIVPHLAKIAAEVGRMR